MSRDRVLDHLTDMVEATNLPINADFESGFAPDAAGVAESVRLAVETGVAGLSIEDSTGDASRPIYELHTAVARIRAARKAIDKAGGDTLLVGRAECFLHGQPDIGQTIHRLKAYADAGADCLYAPGIRTPEHISAAKNAGVKFSIDSDAHSLGDLNNIPYGVASARLGGLTDDDVINTWPLKRLTEFLRRPGALEYVTSE